MNNLSVFAILTYNNQIFLCKRNYGNYKWTLPGGTIEPGESIIEALKREIFEETGQNVINYRYVLPSFYKKGYSVAFVFVVKLNSLSDCHFSNDELQSVKLFNIHNLPENLSDRQKKWIEISLSNLVYNNILNM